MAIFLVQHGLSLAKDQDPQKGLSEQGRQESTKIADVAKFYQVCVTKIFHSGKKRAVETAQIFKDILPVREPMEKMDDIYPMDDVTIFGQVADPESNIMIVGHLPYMEKLVSYLTCQNTDTRVLKFQNAGIVCLDAENGDWFIKWTLNPNIN